MKVVVYQDKAGEHRWKLLARNGRCLCDSGEGYKTKRGAVRACALLADAAAGSVLFDAFHAVLPDAEVAR